MSESRGLELKDSRRRPQREPGSSGTGWPRLLGVPATEVITVTVGPSLGQSVQSVLGSRLALRAHRKFLCWAKSWERLAEGPLQLQKIR